MKKFMTLAGIALLALSLSACSKKAENAETAATEADSAQEASGGSASSGIEITEDTEYEYFDGIITAIEGMTISLSSDEGSMSFDISYADTDEDHLILRGSEAEIEYIVEDGADVYTATYIYILMDNEDLANWEGRDPVIYGRYQVSDSSELYILDDAGIERCFDRQIAREVSFGGIKAGDDICVTYAGELLYVDEDDEGIFSMPTAIKIVSVDALETDDAKADYITGRIDQIYSDGIFTLDVDDLSFEVSMDDSMISGFEEGDKVRVYYEGSLSGMTVEAVSIEAE